MPFVSLFSSTEEAYDFFDNLDEEEKSIINSTTNNDKIYEIVRNTKLDIEDSAKALEMEN